MILGTCHQIPSSKMSHGFVLPNNSGEHPHFHMLASTEYNHFKFFLHLDR